MQKLVILGCGFSARCFVEREGHRFTSIIGTVRDPSHAKPTNARLIAFDGKSASDDLRHAVREADALLVSIAPDQSGDPVLNSLAKEIREAKKLRSIVYLSTIGVYGDRQGEWVSEDDAPRPTQERSIRRLAAEEAWQRLGAECHVPTAILRLAGIYGPGRNALADVAEGTARRLIKPKQVFNRIHVEDIANTIAAAFAAKADRVFNVTDDAPCAPQDVVAFAASLLGVEPPPEIPFETAALSPMARSFYGENKRVSNAKIKQELGVRLEHPTFREGFSALFAQGEGQKAGYAA